MEGFFEKYFIRLRFLLQLQYLLPSLRHTARHSTTLCNNFSFFRCSTASCLCVCKLIFCKSIIKLVLLRTHHSHCKWKLDKITCKSNHAQICPYLLLSLDWTRLWPMVSLISCNAVWVLGAYTLLFVSYRVISQGRSAALMLVFFPSSSSVSLSLVLGLCGPLAFHGPSLIKAPLRGLSGSRADTDLMICVFRIFAACVMRRRVTGSVGSISSH